MRLKLFLFLISMLPCLCLATEITCYSSGKQIYHGYGTRIVYSDDFLAFTEKKTKNQIAIFSECMLVEHHKKK